MKGRQRGVALLLVLWGTLLLAALLVGVAAASRSHSEAALYGAEQVRAELAAEAGIAHAVAGLRAPDVRAQWVPDGRPYRFAFDGARVTVSIIDVTGQIDLNATPPELLRSLLEAAGADPGRAGRLVDAIAGWRGSSRQQPGGLRTLRSAASPVGPVHGPFRSIDQLARLPGMDMALFDRIQPAVTVFSGRDFPDASYAGPMALAALRGIDEKDARALVAARRQRPAERGAGNGQAIGAVANGPLVAGYGGVVQRVFSTAAMPDGTRIALDVTLRMALTGERTRPYKVLDWRTDSTPRQ